MYRGNSTNLFRDNNLDAYLRARGQQLDAQIMGLSIEKFKAINEPEFISKTVNEYTVTAPTISDNKIKVDAKEGDVTIGGRSHGYWDDEGPFTVQGLHITVSIPFTGDPDLFTCRPSTWSSGGTPDATIMDGQIILSYETNEKDPEKIKQLWLGDIQAIKDNLGWITRDVAGYNSSLERNVSASYSKRKKQAESSQSLIEKLKQ